VTILFADIVNFTAFSNNVQPNEVFALLREVFTEFDKLCLKQKVYKLYTIGDCYVAISITEKENRNIYEEAKNVVLFAFSMLEVITAVREKNEAYQNFNMRIGIHTVFQKIKKNLNIWRFFKGDIIGGIVGTDIIRYDVYGNNAYIANKMESNGKPGSVNVSEKTRNMLMTKFDDEFIFENNKPIFISNTGENIESFFINKK